MEEKFFKPSESFFDVKEHIESINFIIEYIGNLTPGKTILFSLFFLLVLVPILYKVLSPFNLKKMWMAASLGGFVLIYGLGVYFLKQESTQKVKFNLMKERVLEQMVYLSADELPTIELYSALDYSNEDLKQLGDKYPDYFHHHISQGVSLLRIKEASALAAIAKKKKVLIAEAAAQEEVSLTSLNERAVAANFGMISPALFTEISSDNDSLDLNIRGDELVVRNIKLIDRNTRIMNDRQIMNAENARLALPIEGN